MTTALTAWVLLAALLHAAWNFLLKGSTHKTLDTLNYAVCCSLLSLPLLVWVPSLPQASWPWLAGSLLTQTAYFVLLAKAYQHTDLSLAYPVMRGLAPFWVSLVMWALGQTPGLWSGLGILLICLGIVVPALWALRQTSSTRQTIRPALLNSAIIATYTLLDAQGIQTSGQPLSYIAWLFALNGIGIAMVCLHTLKPQQVAQHLRIHWTKGVLASVLSSGSYGIVLWAMTQAPVAAVSALRETSVIFAAWLGGQFLKEKDRTARLAGAVLVAAGAALLRWGG